MLKEMFRLDRFYYVDESNLIAHRDYPPILQLFELFWVKLCGNYSEIYAERAVHTFSLALILPMVCDCWVAKKQNLKKIGIAVVACIPIILTVVLFDQHNVINTIYNDYPMAMVVAYLILLIILSKRIGWFEILALSLGGSFLLLLKQMGMPLYIMSICILIGVLIIRKKKKLKNILNRKTTMKIVLACCLLLLPFIWYGIWNLLTAGMSHQFDLSSISISDFINMLLGRSGEDWQRVTAHTYISALSQRSISTSYIQISFLSSVGLFILGVTYYYRRCLKTKQDKKTVILLGVILTIGAIGYAIAMFILYPTSFSQSESLRLASFERYMGTYSIILFTIVIVLLIEYYIKHNRLWSICCMAIIAIVVTTPAMFAKLTPKLTATETNSYYQEAEYIREALGTDGEGSNIFALSPTTLGYTYFVQYYLNDYHFNSPIDLKETDSSTNAKTFYEKTLLPLFMQYDYFYLAEADEDFQTQYCPLITNQCPMQDHKIYRINKTGESSFELQSIDN